MYQSSCGGELEEKGVRIGTELRVADSCGRGGEFGAYEVDEAVRVSLGLRCVRYVTDQEKPGGILSGSGAGEGVSP